MNPSTQSPSTQKPQAIRDQLHSLGDQVERYADLLQQSGYSKIGEELARIGEEIEHLMDDEDSGWEETQAEAASPTHWSSSEQSFRSGPLSSSGSKTASKTHPQNDFGTDSASTPNPSVPTADESVASSTRSEMPDAKPHAF